MVGHSGYHFPLLFPPEMHNFHHKKFYIYYTLNEFHSYYFFFDFRSKGSFSSIALLDDLHGTNELFNKSIDKINYKFIIFGKSLNRSENN